MWTATLFLLTSATLDERLPTTEGISRRRQAEEEHEAPPNLGENPHVNDDFPLEEITMDGLVLYADFEADMSSAGHYVLTQADQAAIEALGDHATDEEAMALMEKLEAEAEADAAENGVRRRSEKLLPTCFTHHSYETCGSCNRKQAYIQEGESWDGCWSGWSWKGWKKICKREPMYWTNKVAIHAVEHDCMRWLREGKNGNGINDPRGWVGGSALGQACINGKLVWWLKSTSNVLYTGRPSGNCNTYKGFW